MSSGTLNSDERTSPITSVTAAQWIDPSDGGGGESATPNGSSPFTSPATALQTETPFDPSRSSTPHTYANSPLPLGRSGSTASNASDSGHSSQQLPVLAGQLPILSLPALPGQRVCPCMRAVEESPYTQTMQPTTSSSNAAAASAAAAALSSPASPAPVVGGASSTFASPSPPVPASLDRFLSLQDRFWLSVGEVALHNDDHLVERGVDSMETLAVKLAHLSQQLTHTMTHLRSEQLRGVESIMVELERKNSELVEYLKHARGEETLVRERIDQLSLKVDKAKKTVTMGGTLGLASSKQQREQAHLDAVRLSRDQALAALELIVTNRNLAQNQMLNVSTIAAECRISEMDKRDYKSMYAQVQSSFFHRSFGAAYQSQVDTMVKVLAKCREQSHECVRRQRLIEQTIHELRGRISLVVSAYWK